MDDISIYGSNHKIDATSISWVIDTDLEGELLVSKHFLAGSGSDDPQLNAKECSLNCLYCDIAISGTTTTEYCKSCMDGFYLDKGKCSDSSELSDGYFDYLEKEYKYPNGDEDPMKASTDCINQTYSYDNKCYGECPSGTYPYTNSDSNIDKCGGCNSNCLECESDSKTCTKCKSGWLLNDSNEDRKSVV